MGTRSLTVFQETDGTEIAVMYRQFDGYPEEHGKHLAEFLAKGRIVNGFGSGDSPNFNGMGCLAAQVIAHFKKGIGNFYLHRAGVRDCGEEYIYTIKPCPSGMAHLTIYSVYGKKELWAGEVGAFDLAAVKS